jgi:hypothetical protein
MKKRTSLLLGITSILVVLFSFLGCEMRMSTTYDSIQEYQDIITTVVWDIHDEYLQQITLFVQDIIDENDDTSEELDGLVDVLQAYNYTDETTDSGLKFNLYINVDDIQFTENLGVKTGIDSFTLDIETEIFPGAWEYEGTTYQVIEDEDMDLCFFLDEEGVVTEDFFDADYTQLIWGMTAAIFEYTGINDGSEVDEFMWYGLSDHGVVLVPGSYYND